jgi:Ca2+-binding EF-hand superfamily protein
MSVSALGSASAYAHIRWLSQSDRGSDATPADALKSLFQAIAGDSSSDQEVQGAGADDGSGKFGGSSGMPQISAATMTTLLATQSGQGNRAADKAKALIARFDADGDGKVSQSEYKTVIGSDIDQARVDAVFSKFDGDGDGSIGQDELQTDLEKSSLGAALAFGLRKIAVSPAKSQEITTNADGTRTITTTRVDGTKFAIRTMAASRDSSGGSDASSGNLNRFNLGSLLKSMVSLQAKFAPPTTNVSV